MLGNPHPQFVCVRFSITPPLPPSSKNILFEWPLNGKKTPVAYHYTQRYHAFVSPLFNKAILFTKIIEANLKK